MIVTVKINEREMLTGILGAIRTRMNAALHNAAVDIRREILFLIDQLMTNSAEYQSLLSGALRDEFAIKDPNSPLRDIVKSIQNGLEVSVVPVAISGDTLRGGIVIKMVRADFSDVLSVSGITYKTKSVEVEWLKWLLTYGDRIILANTSISYNPSASRPKGVAAIDSGFGFRVPPQFSGTLADNWITRTFNVSVIQSKITEIIRRSLERRL